MLPQSTVAARVSGSYSKAACRIPSEIHAELFIFFLSSSSPTKPSTLTRDTVKTAIDMIVGKFPKDGSFVLSLKRN